MACLYEIWAGQDLCGFIGLYDKGGLDEDDKNDIVAYVDQNLQNETHRAILECVNEICEDLAYQYGWGDFYVLEDEDQVAEYGFWECDPRQLILW